MIVGLQAVGSNVSCILAHWGYYKQIYTPISLLAKSYKFRAWTEHSHGVLSIVNQWKHIAPFFPLKKVELKQFDSAARRVSSATPVLINSIKSVAWSSQNNDNFLLSSSSSVEPRYINNRNHRDSADEKWQHECTPIYEVYRSLISSHCAKQCSANSNIISQSLVEYFLKSEWNITF